MSTDAAVPPLLEALRLTKVAYRELTDTPFVQASVAVAASHLERASALLYGLVGAPPPHKGTPPV